MTRRDRRDRALPPRSKKKSKARRKKLLECGQCSNLTIEGTVDPSDGVFYCFVCWEEFGSLPEDAHWLSCILCKKSKPDQLFSKTQQKKKKPICLECTPRRVADALDKKMKLGRHVSEVNQRLSGNSCMFVKPDKDYPRWRLYDISRFLKNKVPFFFEGLVGVNNVKDCILDRRKDEDLWEVTIGEEKTIRNFWKWPGDEDQLIAKFAIPESMTVYSLRGVLDNLSITFILAPSTMYDVREKYTLEKVRLYFGNRFGFNEKLLSKLWWPVQIYLERFLDCSEALSNDIVSFTGEVLMQCTFTSAELGGLFKPWDTWEADLSVMGDYKKRVSLAEAVVMSAETRAATDEKDEISVSPDVNEDSTNDAATDLKINKESAIETDNESPKILEQNNIEDEHDSFEVVQMSV